MPRTVPALALRRGERHHGAPGEPRPRIRVVLCRIDLRCMPGLAPKVSPAKKHYYARPTTSAAGPPPGRRGRRACWLRRRSRRTRAQGTPCPKPREREGKAGLLLAARTASGWNARALEQPPRGILTHHPQPNRAARGPASVPLSPCHALRKRRGGRLLRLFAEIVSTVGASRPIARGALRARDLPRWVSIYIKHTLAQPKKSNPSHLRTRMRGRRRGRGSCV